MPAASTKITKLGAVLVKGRGTHMLTAISMIVRLTAARKTRFRARRLRRGRTKNSTTAKGTRPFRTLKSSSFQGTLRFRIRSGNHGVGRPRSIWVPRSRMVTPNGVAKPGAGRGKAAGSARINSNRPKPRSPMVSTSAPMSTSWPSSASTNWRSSVLSDELMGAL